MAGTDVETAHVLFMDMVGYSRLAFADQTRLVGELRDLLRRNSFVDHAEATREMLCLPTGDGVALVFLRNPLAPVECAIEVARAVRPSPDLQLRMGVHSGPVCRLKDINGTENVAGPAMNLAQRVMDCGDAGHVLLSSVAADLVRQTGLWGDCLFDLGIHTVKHGVQIHLFNFCGAGCGNPAIPNRLKTAVDATSHVGNSHGSPDPSPGERTDGRQRRQIVLLHQRGIEPDATKGFQLEQELRAADAEVFVDRHLNTGLDWARQVEHQIQTADIVVALLSDSTAHSEILACELQTAREAAHRNGGRPRVWPVWIQDPCAVSTELQSILSSLPSLRWEGQSHTTVLVREILAPPAGGAAEKIEPAGGAVPLDSRFYVIRAADEALAQALQRHDSIILVKGARQMGKTSLLARGTQQARRAGSKVVLSDFQKLNAADLASPETLLRSLAEAMADQLDLTARVDDGWNPRRSPSVNFERFLRREALGVPDRVLVWGLDEVDRLFSCAFASEVFGLFRSWHNERALDPDGPWSRLTMVIAYATEAHLFISDVNQSPFNVGTRLSLDDFTLEQVLDLNRRHGDPLRNLAETERFFRLLGGQPFLVRCGLREMTGAGLDLVAFEAIAARDDGLFGDHLRRMLVLLGKESGLCAALRDVLGGRPCPSLESFYRLRSAGIIVGETPADARLRCQLYATFLGRHLA